MDLCLPSNPSLLLVEEEEVVADLYDTHMMLSLRYWALVLDTQSLPSDNHKGGRELGRCPASIILNVRKGNSTHHFTPYHTVHFEYVRHTAFSMWLNTDFTQRIQYIPGLSTSSIPRKQGAKLLSNYISLCNSFCTPRLSHSYMNLTKWTLGKLLAFMKNDGFAAGSTPYFQSPVLLPFQLKDSTSCSPFRCWCPSPPVFSTLKTDILIFLLSCLYSPLCTWDYTHTPAFNITAFVWYPLDWPNGNSVWCSSNKSPTRCNNFPVYYPDVYLQLNMFRAFPRPSSGAQWLQWQPLVLPSYHGDSRAVFVVYTHMLVCFS